MIAHLVENILGIIAMCYNLMKEEILVRLQELKADLIERYIFKIIFQQMRITNGFFLTICMIPKVARR